MYQLVAVAVGRRGALATAARGPTTTWQGSLEADMVALAFAGIFYVRSHSRAGVRRSSDSAPIEGGPVLGGGAVLSTISQGPRGDQSPRWGTLPLADSSHILSGGREHQLTSLARPARSHHPQTSFATLDMALSGGAPNFFPSDTVMGQIFVVYVVGAICAAFFWSRAIAVGGVGFHKGASTLTTAQHRSLETDGWVHSVRSYG